ncbi:MAG: VOC family protein [Caldilineales bacterium]
MQLKFISLMVQDQEHALQFYTSVLGFEKMADIPMGEYRWLTVTSPDRIEGSSWFSNPWPSSRRVYQSSVRRRHPGTAFITADIVEADRLKGAAGVPQ